MKKIILNNYEQEIENTLNVDLTKGVNNKRKNMLQESVVKTHKKDKCINIRLTTTDLQNIKARALEEGLPYQTLISSIIHKYINNPDVKRI
jgi:predicted DNA binding CopG/RHH family protein